MPAYIVPVKKIVTITTEVQEVVIADDASAAIDILFDGYTTNGYIFHKDGVAVEYELHGVVTLIKAGGGSYHGL
jgi:hypothetical protein